MSGEKSGCRAAKYDAAGAKSQDRSLAYQRSNSRYFINALAGKLCCISNFRTAGGFSTHSRVYQRHLTNSARILATIRSIAHSLRIGRLSEWGGPWLVVAVGW